MWDGFLEEDSVKFLEPKMWLLPYASQELVVLVITASVPQFFTFGCVGKINSIPSRISGLQLAHELAGFLRFGSTFFLYEEKF